jgi:hypothetical protein
LDHRSIGRCFQRDAAGALDGPFVVLLEQDRADESDDGGFAGQDADDFGLRCGA